MSFAHLLEKHYKPGLEADQQADCIDEAFGSSFSDKQWELHGIDDDGSDEATNMQLDIIMRQCKEADANPEIIAMVESWKTDGF